jgi:hypothetical protein
VISGIRYVQSKVPPETHRRDPWIDDIILGGINALLPFSGDLTMIAVQNTITDYVPRMCSAKAWTCPRALGQAQGSGGSVRLRVACCS